MSAAPALPRWADVVVLPLVNLGMALLRRLEGIFPSGLRDAGPGRSFQGSNQYSRARFAHSRLTLYLRLERLQGGIIPMRR